jgi:hypothetical protein
MAKLVGTHHIVTASFTDTGAPAYLTATGDWVSDLQQANAVQDESQANELLALALRQERVVSDPYTIMINQGGALKEPLSQRELIRAKGPTTPLRRPD